MTNKIGADKGTEQPETAKPYLSDLGEALSILKQAVETQGDDFLYLGPAYIGLQCANIPRSGAALDDPRGKTGCLIGTAMKIFLGPVFDQIDWTSSANRFSNTFGPAFRDYLSPDVRVLYGIAQRIQDQGFTWGAAYNAAAAFEYVVGIAEGHGLQCHTHT